MSERVIVVIVTFERAPLLRRCLDAVLAQALPPEKCAMRSAVSRWTSRRPKHMRSGRRAAIRRASNRHTAPVPPSRG